MTVNPEEPNRCRLHLWDVSNSWPYPFPPLAANGSIRNLAFYPDGTHLAFIRHGGIPAVGNLLTRRQVYPSLPDDFCAAREHGLVSFVALSSDDAMLAAQAARGAITVWDMHQRKLLLALPEEHRANWALPWSPDRQRLAAGFSDGSLVIWNIPRIRAQLAEIGLDWHDSPAPAAHSEQVEAGSVPIAFEPAK